MRNRTPFSPSNFAKMKHSICLLLFGLLFLGLKLKGQVNVPDSLDHQGFQRQYIVHLPPNYTGAAPTPVVIVLHGGSGNMQSAQGFTEMNMVSNQNDFLAVYPQGYGLAPPGFSWADGRGTTADMANIDDVGFMLKLIDSLGAAYNVDTSRVYVCGFSNGGFMTQRLACEIPGKFAAIGGLGCSLDTNLIQTCTPLQSVPMAYFFGTSDPEVPYAGGSMNNPAVTPVVPVDTAIQFWVENNQCLTVEPVVNFPNTVLSDSSTAELYVYTDCDCDADVYFYKIINGGHTWPGVPISQFPQLGNTNEDIHASFQLWDFFDQFAGCSMGTGIEEAVAKLVVYPNPVRDWLRIEVDGGLARVYVRDLQGKLMLETVGEEIDMGMLSAGIYLVVLELENGGRQMVKVMKE